MKRLRDETDGEDRAQNEAARLVRSVEPLSVPSGLKMRVRAGLREKDRAGASRIFGVLSPAAFAFVIGTLAVASAMATGVPTRVWHWIVLPSTSAPPRPSVGHRARAPRTRQAAAVALPASPTNPSIVPPPIVPRPTRAPEPVLPTGFAPSPHPSTHRNVSHHVERVDVDLSSTRLDRVEPHEATLLVSGLRALRQANDATRASTIFSEYLRSYPHGAFSEEVTALRIEAAARAGEPTASAAAAYLHRYPHGRFRAMAERAQ